MIRTRFRGAAARALDGGGAARRIGLSRRGLYPAAAFTVLLLAGALRFYDLAGDSLWYDEAVAALNSQGTFTETVERTRTHNTSPILYPILLWIVQKIEISNFSVRFLPALGSTAMVAVLLFLLPGAGVGRRAALLAGAFAAVSAAAINEAHGVREYSLDALLAALLVVGLLRWLSGRGGALLTAALLLGPFVQYGLVLFGSAVLAVGFAFGGSRRLRSGPGPARRGAGDALRGRFGFVYLVAAFAAACAASYFTTLRGQLQTRSLAVSHVSGYYREESFDFVSAIDFVWVSIRETLGYHLTTPFAAATALAGGLLLVFRLARRESAVSRSAPGSVGRGRGGGAGPARVLAALLAASFLVAVAAALAGVYPLGWGWLGEGRHGLYLSPVVFLVAGLVWVALADAAAATGRKFAGAALLGAGLVGGLGAGAARIARLEPFGGGGNIEQVLSVLAERAQGGEVIYAPGVATPQVRFYPEARPEGLVYGRHGCHDVVTDCAREVLQIARKRLGAPNRAWVIYEGRRVRALRAALRALAPALRLEVVVPGRETLFLVPNLGEVVRAGNRRRLAEYETVLADDPEEPRIRSRFEVHHRGNALFYFRMPCSAADVEARFFLRFEAVDEGGKRAVVRDFDFPEYGVLVDEVCAARVPLPPGEFNAVFTGQSFLGQSLPGQSLPGQSLPGRPFPGEAPLWAARWRLDLGSYRTAFETIRGGGAGPPAVRSAFDLYLHEGALFYWRASCGPEEIEARFFLHLFPDPDAAATARGSGSEYDLRDFDFEEHGIVEDGECLAIVPLPRKGYSRFETGQWSASNSWRAAAPLDRARYRAALRSLDRGEWGEPEARAGFDLYLTENELRYFREPCAARDAEARFFLHLHGPRGAYGPISSAEGPGKPAFENRDFAFSEYGVLLDGRCLAMVPLPVADLFRIVTGQFVAGGPRLWQADLWPARRLLESRIESVAAGALGPPVASSTFDLYLDDSAVLFHRADCSPSEVEARFLLHFFPTEVTDLPLERREHGFLNLDFDFTDYGLRSGGRCLARAPLPDIPGGRLRAGQFLADGERLWTAEFGPLVPPVEETGSGRR